MREGRESLEREQQKVNLIKITHTHTYEKLIVKQLYKIKMC